MKHRHGFTMVEVMVVLLLMGMVAVVGVTATAGWRAPLARAEAIDRISRFDAKVRGWCEAERRTGRIVIQPESTWNGTASRSEVLSFEVDALDSFGGSDWSAAEPSGGPGWRLAGLRAWTLAAVRTREHDWQDRPMAIGIDAFGRSASYGLSLRPSLNDPSSLPEADAIYLFLAGGAGQVTSSDQQESIDAVWSSPTLWPDAN